jgi:glycosyltransferase involved in cell wall biosynthesis
MNNIFIIVPAWNEEEQIGETLKKLLDNNYNNIVVVDDCSSDKTFEIAKQFPIFVLRHKINRGQGAALQTGTDFAVKNGAEIIAHFDSDGQHRTEDIPELIKPIIDGKAEFVFGSRFLKRANEHELEKRIDANNIPFLKKHIILPIARVINYFFTGLKLSDAHCGLRAFNAKIADKIHLSQDGMAHNTEYPYLVKKNKIKYTEVPIVVIYNEFGQGIGGGFKILKELLMKKIVK